MKIARSDGRVGNRFRPPSVYPSQNRTLLLWLQSCGLLRIIGEIRNCVYRIVRPERIIGVDFEELRERVLASPVGKLPDPEERYPYMSGIRALRKTRPWLTWEDGFLFLQGWFHAEACLLRIHSECRTQFASFPASQQSSIGEKSAVLSIHEEAAGQSRVCPIHPSDASHYGGIQDGTPEAHGRREKGEAV